MQQSNDESLLGININNSTGGATEFKSIVNGLIGSLETITLVKVKAVNATGVNPVGYVEVQPLVAQVDGAGNLYPHSTLYNVPYFRLQGGKNAVICDPSVGDIGLCAFASRDISAVKRNKAVSAPSSKRQYDLSDGLYIGGFINGTPEQYIHFTNAGIVIHSTSEIKLEAPSVKINTANMETNTSTYAVNSTSTAKFNGGGGIDADGDIKAQGVSLENHTHSGVQTGGSNTGKPN